MRSNRNSRRQQDNEIGKNPIELIDEVGKQIQRRAVGYQAGLRKGVVKLYWAIFEIEKNFELYSDLVQAPCLASRKRIREATEENFQEYVHEAVVRRAFDGSDVSPSCVSKYIGVVRHCSQKKIPPGRASAQIEEWGGLEDTYKSSIGNAKKRNSSRDRAGTTSKAKTSSSGQTKTSSAENFGDDYLHITLKKKALRRFLKAKKGDERLVEIRCMGRDEANYLIWELVGDDNASSSDPSNDDNDYGDIEDAA